MRRSFGIDINGGNGIRRAELLLRDIPGAADKAVWSAVSRTAKHLRAVSSRLIREHYAISANVLRDKDVTKVRYDIRNGASVTINFAGHKIPLYKFNGTTPKYPSVDDSKKKIRAIIQNKWFSMYPSVAPKAHVSKYTSPYIFRNAFVAEIKNNGKSHIGIFRRNGKVSRSGGDAISEIMGLSVPQMLGNSEVREKLNRQAADKFEQLIAHEIAAFINGWRR